MLGFASFILRQLFQLFTKGEGKGLGETALPVLLKARPGSGNVTL